MIADSTDYYPEPGICLVPNPDPNQERCGTCDGTRVVRDDAGAAGSAGDTGYEFPCPDCQPAPHPSAEETQRWWVLACSEHGPLQVRRNEYLAHKCSEATPDITGEGGDPDHPRPEWIEVTPLARAVQAERERDEWKRKCEFEQLITAQVPRIQQVARDAMAREEDLRRLLMAEAWPMHQMGDTHPDMPEHLREPIKWVQELHDERDRAEERVGALGKLADEWEKRADEARPVKLPQPATTAEEAAYREAASELRTLLNQPGESEQ